MLMKAEFTAVIEPSPRGGYLATCPEVPGANGHGRSIAEAEEKLKDAIARILGDRLADDTPCESGDETFLNTTFVD